MNKIPAVDKTIQLLTALSEKDFSQAELSEKLDISMSTAYRILMTLQAHRWVRKKCYSAGKDRRTTSRPCRKAPDRLQTLHPSGRGTTHLFRAEPPGPVALTGQPGSTFPLIEGSVGAALLADASEKEIRELIAACSADIPEKKEPELLFNAVREARRRGAVLNARPNRWNIAALSVPVRDHAGNVIAALTIVGCGEDFAGNKRNEWELLLKSFIQ